MYSMHASMLQAGRRPSGSAAARCRALLRTCTGSCWAAPGAHVRGAAAHLSPFLGPRSRAITMAVPAREEDRRQVRG